MQITLFLPSHHQLLHSPQGSLTVPPSVACSSFVLGQPLPVIPPPPPHCFQRILARFDSVSTGESRNRPTCWWGLEQPALPAPSPSYPRFSTKSTESPRPLVTWEFTWQFYQLLEASQVCITIHPHRRVFTNQMHLWLMVFVYDVPEFPDFRFFGVWVPRGCMWREGVRGERKRGSAGTGVHRYVQDTLWKVVLSFSIPSDPTSSNVLWQL